MLHLSPVRGLAHWKVNAEILSKYSNNFSRISAKPLKYGLLLSKASNFAASNIGYYTRRRNSFRLQTVKAMNNGGNGQQQGIDLFKLADFVAAGFLFGLIVTGQFNLFEGPLQFISGITLILIAGGGILNRVLESVIESDVSGDLVTIGNCPWCGSEQKVLDLLTEHQGKSVPQQCAACSQTFIVQNKVFIRSSPMFDEYSTYSSKFRNPRYKESNAEENVTIIDVESYEKPKKQSERKK